MATSWAAFRGASSATPSTPCLPVIQVAELGGVYAVSFELAAVNAALAALLGLGWRRAWPGALATTALLLLSLGFGVRVLGDDARAAQAHAASVEVAVIQPVIEQTIKWDPVRNAEIIAIHEGLDARGGALAPSAHRVAGDGRRHLPARRSCPCSPVSPRLSGELGIPLLIGSVDRLDAPPAEVPE